MQLREKELELERVRYQPDHEKDQEIQRLRLALEDRERTEATRTVLCTSLAEEADQLRGQLGATVKVCQELLARLEKEKKGGREVEEMVHQQKEVCSALGVRLVFLCYMQRPTNCVKMSFKEVFLFPFVANPVITSR